VREEVEDLQRSVKQLQLLYAELAGRGGLDQQSFAELRRQLKALQTAPPQPVDLLYRCASTVQIGDPVGISAEDTVSRADASLPLLAIGFCAAKLSSTQCLVRRVGLVPRAGSQAGAVHYLGVGPGAVTVTDPFANPAAKIFQRLAVGKNPTTLDACVTLHFITLRV